MGFFMRGRTIAFLASAQAARQRLGKPRRLARRAGTGSFRGSAMARARGSRLDAVASARFPPRTAPTLRMFMNWSMLEALLGTPCASLDSWSGLPPLLTGLPGCKPDRRADGRRSASIGSGRCAGYAPGCRYDDIASQKLPDGFDDATPMSGFPSSHIDQRKPSRGREFEAIRWPLATTRSDGR